MARRRRNKWALYEARKAVLQRKGLTPLEYARAIRELAKKLRI